MKKTKVHKKPSKKNLQKDALKKHLTNNERDFKGYGQNPPHPKWPNQARIAVQFVLNYEEGSENCLLNGDKASEAFLSEIVGAQAYPKARHMNMESIYEFGSRAGFWRLHRIFTERKCPLTVFAVARALEFYPEIAEPMLNADWEIASHGYRWIDYQFVSEKIEKEHIQKAIEIHTRITGERPLGFYQGRMSPQTRKIILQEGGFLYDADSYADELPYWIPNSFAEKKHLIIPYTLDVNDMRFATPQGFNSGDQFFNYLKDSFDVLYAEGETTPKMLSIGLHCRLAGRPGRAAAISKFLDYILQKNHVWICRRIDIARHWYKNFYNQ